MLKDHEISLQAWLNGEKTFIPSEPCKKGHLAPRYVINHGCTECLKKPKRIGTNNRERLYITIPKDQVPLLREIVKSMGGLLL